MHKWLEDYIKTGVLNEPGSNPYSLQSHSMAQSIINQGLIKCSEYWGTEVPLYYPKIYAGTTDLVGVHDGSDAIMDHKQSNKLKKREYIGDYFVQLAAYAQAHNNMHGTDIRKGVILMCQQPKQLEDGSYDTPVYQEFVLEGAEFDYYCDEWNKRVELYYLTV